MSGDTGFSDGAVDLGHGLHAVITERDAGDEDRPVEHVLEALEHRCRLDDGTQVIQGVPAEAFSESHHATFSAAGDLTVRPAIACDTCGLHGLITDGAFEPQELET